MSHRIYARDIATEAIAGLATRPGRAALTVMGTVVGIAALVATLGLTTTARAQVGDRFDILAATMVTVEDTQPRMPHTPLDADAEQRVRVLPGVVAVGTVWQLPVHSGDIKALSPAFHAPRAGTTQPVAAVGVSPGAFAVMQAAFASGGPFTEFEERSASHVVVLGSSAARSLGVAPDAQRRAVYIDGVRFTVVGIVSDVERLPSNLISAMVPMSTAQKLWGSRAEAPISMLVGVRPGAGQVVSNEVASAILPPDPSRLKVVAPPDPKVLRNQISGDITSLFLGLAAVSLLVGVIGIANTTLVSVIERTGEIGLRRALGAKRRHVGGQFLLESAIAGTMGGLVGACIGLLVIVGVCAANTWTAVVSPLAVLPAPFIGTLTGLLAGAYPSLKAASLQPLDALRR